MNWIKQRNQEIANEAKLLRERKEQLIKKGLILDRLSELYDILPEDYARADEIIKDLDVLIERYKGGESEQ